MGTFPPNVSIDRCNVFLLMSLSIKNGEYEVMDLCVYVECIIN